MKALHRFLPWIMLAFAIVYAGSRLVSTDLADTEYDLRSFGQIPASSGGRTMPLDSVARNSLLAISARQSVRTRDGEISAIQWYIDLITDPPVTIHRNIFRIDHPDVVSMLGLNEENRIRFSYAEIQPILGEINRQAILAMDFDHLLVRNN